MGAGGTPPERLWEVILRRHRRALTTILPGLRDLAENGQPDLRSLRMLAAQVLGRIGEMDPARITLPLLERWTRSGGGRHHLVVGPLLEGVLGSANDRYQSLCFAHLKRLHTGARANGEGGLLAVHAAIGAYGWMGDHDLVLAMRELGGIAREHLVPVIADVQALAQWVTELETECRRQAAPGVNLRDVSPACGSLLSSLIELVFMDNGETLLRTQVSLLTLCSTTDPVRVFREMRKWVREGGWQAGVLMGLLFLHERGIAATLAAGRECAADDGSGAAAGDPILSSLAAGGDELRHMAGFLGDIYESFSTPHLVDARLLGYCRDSLQDHLLGWIREAIPVPAHAAALRSLFHAMARTHEGVLREPMEKLFTRGEFFDPAEPKLRTFAASLRG